MKAGKVLIVTATAGSLRVPDITLNGEYATRLRFYVQEPGKRKQLVGEHLLPKTTARMIILRADETCKAKEYKQYKKLVAQYSRKYGVVAVQSFADNMTPEEVRQKAADAQWHYRNAKKEAV